MVADEPNATPEESSSTEAPEPPEFSKVGPLVAGTLEGRDMQANLSVAASVNAHSLAATGSVIGVATIGGETAITASMTPAVISRGDTTIQQSYASAIIVGGGDTKVHQAAAPIIIGKTMELNQAGGGVLVAGEADVKHSWVGIVLAPKAAMSEDSHVIISTKAALIIAAAVLGGFAFVAIAFVLGARRVSQWRPISLPSLQSMGSHHSHRSQASASALHSLDDALKKMPDLSAIQERWIHRKA